jgi:predicted ATP-dependent endonuclease of OLD family
MKLRRAQIQNFRSIVDSGVVDIEDRVTVVIGKNEQGKTTFLRGLASLSPRVTYTPGDLPSHLKPELEKRKASDISIASCWLEPEEMDKAALEKLVPNLETVVFFKVTKFYDNHRTYAVIRSDNSEKALAFVRPDIEANMSKLRSAAESIGQKIALHGERLPAFAAHVPQANAIIESFVRAKFETQEQIVDLVKAITTGLSSLPNQDEPIQVDIAATTKAIEAIQASILAQLQVDQRASFETQLPEFVYHTTVLDRIPNEVPIAEFVANPAEVSRGMYNLCSIAGLSMQKLQDLASADTSTVQSYEDSYQASVSGGLNEYWTQEQYTINFRVGNEKLSVSVNDTTYQPRIPPSERSEGFQWYLSFYATLQNEVAKSASVVLLLDNPGLELHADGQRDIKKLLEEKLRSNAQVIYVTHSPAMIDPFRLEQVRKVELQNDKAGTRVIRVEIKKGDDFDLFDPIRTAIGASLATSLIMNKYNVLVEGAADKPILEAGLALYGGDAGKAVLVNGSVSESKDDFLVRFYARAKVPFAVYVDADSGGRRIENTLSNVIGSKHLVSLKDVFPDRSDDFELEDIVSEACYHQAVEAEYSSYQIVLPANDNKKRMKRYDESFQKGHGIGFSKRRVAERLKAMLLDGSADAETEQNLKAVVGALLEKLAAQVENNSVDNAPSENQAKKAKKRSALPIEDTNGVQNTEILLNDLSEVASDVVGS